MRENSYFQSEYYQPIQFDALLSIVETHSIESLKPFLNEVLRYCKAILLYTYDHLSHRQYAGKHMHLIETIQSEFSDVILILDQTKEMIVMMELMSEVILSMRHMITALHGLARLSGARAILKNNAIELMVNLKLFSKCLEDL